MPNTTPNEPLDQMRRELAERDLKDLDQARKVLKLRGYALLAESVETAMRNIEARP